VTRFPVACAQSSAGEDAIKAGSADRRFCGPRLFRSYYGHRAVFYRGVETSFLSDRYFFIVVRLLRRREQFTEPDFALLARAFNRLIVGLRAHPFG
jgi:hypothetical protein